MKMQAALDAKAVNFAISFRRHNPFYDRQTACTTREAAVVRVVTLAPRFRERVRWGAAAAEPVSLHAEPGASRGSRHPPMERGAAATRFDPDTVGAILAVAMPGGIRSNP